MTLYLWFNIVRVDVFLGDVQKSYDEKGVIGFELSVVAQLHFVPLLGCILAPFDLLELVLSRVKAKFVYCLHILPLLKDSRLLVLVKRHLLPLEAHQLHFELLLNS